MQAWEVSTTRAASRRRLAWFVTLLMVGPSSWMLAGEARADAVTIMSATLPAGRDRMSAAWDGQGHAYLFGGYNGGYTNQIVRYDPSTDTVTIMSATLPTARFRTIAIWDGQNAYVFGGGTGGNSGGLGASYLNQTVRYNPATDTVTIMSATLPTARFGTSAVWDGTHAYIFGGASSSGYLSQIVRYNPATDTATVMSATLPSARFDTSAVWDGTHAYVFGGYSSSGTLKQIVRYTPSTDTVTVMGATLPTGRQCTSALWDEQNAYVFGGYNGVAFLKEIVRYNNPRPVTSAELSGTLGLAGWYTSAVTVTLTCTPAPGTTCSSTQYTLDGGPPQTYAGPFSISTNLAHTLRYRSSGSDGNLEANKTQPVNIDTTEPGGSVVSPLVAVGPYAVDWAAADATSGVAQVEVQELSWLGLLGNGWTTVCTEFVGGASAAAGSCARDTGPGVSCYRAVITDVAGNGFRGDDPAPLGCGVASGYGAS